VIVQGLRPVKLNVRSVETPLQTVASPLSAAVGRSLTVTTAVPVTPPANGLQLTSLKDKILYVVVTVGSTVNVTAEAVEVIVKG
jgi:hypothetical protein